MPFGDQSDDEAFDVASVAGGWIVVGSYARSLQWGHDGRANEASAIRGEVDSMGGTDAFVAAVDYDGQARWLKTFGGAGLDSARGVAVTEQGIFITGFFEGVVDFDREGNQGRRESAGGADVFILGLSLDGEFRFVHTFGGTGVDEGRDVCVCSDGSVAVVGRFTGVLEVIPGKVVSRRVRVGDMDAFVILLGSDGVPRWTRTIDGPGDDTAESVTITSAGDIAIAGSFSGDLDFDPGEGHDLQHSRGFTDPFLIVLSRDGNLQWSWTAGGALVDQATAVVAGSSRDLVLAGFFVDAMLIEIDGESRELRSAGGSDIFVVRFDEGGTPLWARRFGGPRADFAYGLASSRAETGDVLLTGRFDATFDCREDQIGDELTSMGRSDVLLLQLGDRGDCEWAYGLGGRGRDRGWALIDGGATALVVGAFSDEILLHPAGPAVRSRGDADGFMLWIEGR